MHRLFRIIFLNRSLTFKIAVATITPLLLSWVLSIVIGLDTLQSSVQKDFYSESYEKAAKVANSLADADHFYSKDFLTGTIKLLNEVPNIVFSMVLDSDSRYILNHSNPDLNGQLFDQSLTHHKDTLTVSSPVIINETQVGLVIIGISTEEIIDDFQQYRFTLFYIGLVILPIGILLAFLLAKMLSGPVQQMATQSKRIGAGSFDQKITYSGHDTLGELTTSFNIMSSQLDGTLTDLQAERAGLQKTVSEKTAELRKSLKELHDTNLHLEEAIRTRSRFFTSMSHELRTPLNGILGITSLLHEQHFGLLNEKQQEYVEQISESGKHLLSLVNDLLDIAKIDAGSMELNSTPFDLVECITSTLGMIESLIQRKGMDLQTELPEALLVDADYLRVRQILFNLLANAIKFTAKGGQITVQATDETDMLIIKVTDNGIGMTREEQDQIFYEFYQASQNNKGQTDGTGLGLALSKRLVKLHGGNIGVSSEVGIGSTFWFTLPTNKQISQELT